MSTDPGSNSSNLQPKSMKGKYDKRKNNGSTRERRRTNPNLGPKPKWMKHISRNAAYMILRQFDDIASPADVYAWCWEHKKVELMVGMREYVWNRLEGRPFIAENPEKAAKAETLTQDARLQDAIKQLVPPGGAAKSKTVM